MEPVKVRIREHEYLVKGGENEQEVKRIAEYVNSKLKEIYDTSEGLSEKKAAILAALNIAGDYFQLLKEKEALLKQIKQRTESLIFTIDSSIS
ncbi:MAG: cell division protein ZapA [Deltaproteobacteria bacterium]|nr:cell division protein ZapA [Deltaproteobacteria bacterium]MBW2017075.1 cell division protein ZapA [Deltaproteobacteria bacterium]MBW2127762.1 cell division protein ZapA [Deltaproteobacteria bacterium]MBW2303178.1 cell division protein ZapA [Deltaproteobacteria bacterium]